MLVINSESSETLRLGMQDDFNSNIDSISKSSNIGLWNPHVNNCPHSGSNYSISIDKQQKRKDLSDEVNENCTEKILVVDDNCFNCEATKNILKNVLNEAGSEMEIIVGSDGVDILHQIILDQSKGNEIKCIITDENMEYVNGSEAIRIIRNLERLDKIKFVNIISVTGNEDPQLTREIVNAGAQIVLSKPLSKNLIAMALKELNLI